MKIANKVKLIQGLVKQSQRQPAFLKIPIATWQPFSLIENPGMVSHPTKSSTMSHLLDFVMIKGERCSNMAGSVVMFTLAFLIGYDSKYGAI